MSMCKDCPYWDGSQCVSSGYCIEDGISEDLSNERDEEYRRSIVESECYDKDENTEGDKEC